MKKRVDAVEQVLEGVVVFQACVVAVKMQACFEEYVQDW